MERIGVFVCHCGTNIAGTVDVAKVAEELGKVPGVVYSTHYTYMCSSAGQAMIEERIKEDKLTGVVLCSCSPRMHEKTFRACAERAGLNPYKVEVANIREQCSWVMKDMADATEKAVALGKAAIAKSILDTPLTPGETPMTKRALVIGGGIAGITAALDIAEAGFPVDLVEKKPTVGGKRAMLDKTFPTLDCASCIVTPRMTEVGQNPNIRILSYSEVTGVTGYIGNFTVDIKRKARYVDETKCTGCGECTEKCPMKKVPNDFNLNLNNKTAVYIPFAQAVPKIATIDANYCLHMKALKNGKDNVCGMCQKVCGAGAINFNAKDEVITEKYGAIVVATGYNMIDLKPYAEFGYGMLLAANQIREKLEQHMRALLALDVDERLKEALEEWLEFKNDGKESRAKSERVVELLEGLDHTDEIVKGLCERILDEKDYLVKRSVWALGGDGWAYDIGYGGLDHVLASGENINILVFDTEVYSNTGGQASKATPAAAIAKFAASGKRIKKKDLGLMAMSYGYVYVAQVGMGADKNQLMKAMIEAENYDGPSIIIAYAPCINHGIRKGMGKSQNNIKEAVDSGYWQLYRYNPELKKQGKNPFILDSGEPTMDFREFIMGQIRYSSLAKEFPQVAEKLFEMTEVPPVRATWSAPFPSLMRMHSETMRSITRS